jgi:Fe-S-cluster containining protein
MIQIQDTVISELLLERKFVCNLNACKGACCIEGDAGAPLEDDELEELENAFPHVKKYLSKQSIEALEEDLYTIDSDGDTVTQLVKGAACAFVFFDEKNIAKCSIEQAYLDGDISFKKPISCHLFPVRLKYFKSFIAVNYEQIEICGDACALGEELGVKTYQFLKEPLIRRFGEEWFKELELVDGCLSNELK